MSNAALDDDDVIKLAHLLEEADMHLTPWTLKSQLHGVYQKKAEFILKRMLSSEEKTDPDLPKAG